jgi:hypothetical protein
MEILWLYESKTTSSGRSINPVLIGIRVYL